MILVPHEISESGLQKIEQKFFGKTVRYSNANENNMATARVVIIDAIGMLSLLYRYGKYAYVGGGFGRGIHNVLEAAVYGKPVFSDLTLKNSAKPVISRPWDVVSLLKNHPT